MKKSLDLNEHSDDEIRKIKKFSGYFTSARKNTLADSNHLTYIIVEYFGKKQIVTTYSTSFVIGFFLSIENYPTLNHVLLRPKFSVD